MILPKKYVRLLAVSKKTPGERCNWLTITRSVPLIMKVPFWVINGTSPKKTSCSLMSRMERFPVAALVAEVRRVRVVGAAFGTEYVAGMERVGNHRRTAVLTSRAQVMQTFQVAALALPV